MGFLEGTFNFKCIKNVEIYKWENLPQPQDVQHCSNSSCGKKFKNKDTVVILYQGLNFSISYRCRACAFSLLLEERETFTKTLKELEPSSVKFIKDTP